MTAATIKATKKPKARRRPGVYGPERSAGYMLRMSPEQLAALRLVAAEQETTIREFVLSAAIKAAQEELKRAIAELAAEPDSAAKRERQGELIRAQAVTRYLAIAAEETETA